MTSIRAANAAGAISFCAMHLKRGDKRRRTRSCRPIQPTVHGRYLAHAETSGRRLNNHAGGAMTDATALLQQLGFSEYEARAYLALLQRNPLNGYELAKVSGLPRANIYAVLQKLEERGAVVRLDMPNGTRYAPIAPTELIQRVATRFQQTLNAVQRALENLATPADPEYV